VQATGLPAGAPLTASSAASVPGTKDTAWLARLQAPDLPVRWDDRVVRYLEYFRDDPRGHSTFINLYRHSGRYRDAMRRVLRRKSLPEDLVWVSMIESGFDPTARSSVGASGLWQLMPTTAKIYGLSVDRWLDQRLSPSVSTEAAADMLGDLHRRFGSWELAMAAFNMGYAGLASVMRRYNTNDFWSLSRTEGTLPWETTLYVPKILAAAIVAHNLEAFGMADVALDAPVEFDEVTVPAGTSLAVVAQAAGCAPHDVELLNPELRASRTPPAVDGDAGAASACAVRVPIGKGATATQGLARLRHDQPPVDRVVVRFGETLEQIAAAHKTTPQKLIELNAIAPGESVRGGTVLLVPHVDGAPVAPPDPTSVAAAAARPSVVVPSDVFVYPDRKRVFYRVVAGDTPRDIASALHVSADDLRRWNDLDPTARLQEGMTLQAFVGEGTDLSAVVTIPESDVQVLAVGSDEFFAALERERGFKRVTVAAKEGDTLESIGKRYDVPGKTMERINRQNRGHVLKAGEVVAVYVPTASAATASASAAGASATAGATAYAGPAPNGPLPTPPVPDLLP
jgi:membrane-bound lytic murein transglycosylase D